MAQLLPDRLPRVGHFVNSEMMICHQHSRSSQLASILFNVWNLPGDLCSGVRRNVPWFANDKDWRQLWECSGSLPSRAKKPAGPSI
jgi:hypothetical protein